MICWKDGFLSWQWKREGVKDDERRDATDEVEVTEAEGEREESEVGWGWRGEGGIWFQRQGKAQSSFLFLTLSASSMRPVRPATMEFTYLVACRYVEMFDFIHVVCYCLPSTGAVTSVAAKHAITDGWGMTAVSVRREGGKRLRRAVSPYSLHGLG